MGTKRENELITHLTPDQEARKLDYVQEWTDIGLCTEPADREAAEAAIALMYRCGGLAPPEKIVWCDSPLSMSLTAAILSHNVEPSVRAGVGDSVYGQHEAAWLSFYAYYREVCGLHKETEPMEGLSALARSAGWCLPYSNVAFVSERHTTLRRDERSRLHAEDGPAVAYPDGWSIWAWHGVRVPQPVIEQPDTLSVRDALQEKNVEVRRVMLTRIGAERLQAELSASVLDEDIDGQGMPRRLLRLGDIVDRRFVGYTCPSTGREYQAQPVPPEVRTCAEAVAWRFGALDVDDNGKLTKQFDYAPMIEG